MSLPPSPIPPPPPSPLHFIPSFHPSLLCCMASANPACRPLRLQAAALVYGRVRNKGPLPRALRAAGARAAQPRWTVEPRGRVLSFSPWRPLRLYGGMRANKGCCASLAVWRHAREQIKAAAPLSLYGGMRAFVRPLPVALERPLPVALERPATCSPRAPATCSPLPVALERLAARYTALPCAVVRGG